ncbi:MAG: hypothetical protein JF588_16810 [Caulobacterales bacterium]|nr:hypothetical protein [Caulobacterales bacterium]
MTRFPWTGAAVLAAISLAAAPVALAQGHPAGGEGGASTTSIQGNDAQSWIQDAHIHQFYELSAASLKAPPSPEALTAYEQKSFAIFRAFAASRGMSPDAMQDHLKLIPRQVAQIAKEDPKALDTYGSFVDAVFGPQ